MNRVRSPDAVRLSQVLNQLVIPWQTIVADAMASRDCTVILLTERQVSLSVANEIILACKGMQLSTVSKATEVWTEPGFSRSVSVLFRGQRPLLHNIILDALRVMQLIERDKTCLRNQKLVCGMARSLLTRSVNVATRQDDHAHHTRYTCI